MCVLNLIRSDLIGIKGYQPSGEELPCRLNSNELPWSVLPSGTFSLNFYPDSKEKKKLEELLANLYQVKEEQLIITRGSDEGIDFLMRFFLNAGKDAFMQCPPTFPMYEFFARLQQVKLINCPLDAEKEFSFSYEKILRVWRPNCKMIMLCSPNNPTGTLIELATIAKLCKQFKDISLIVIDEAYIDFANSESASSLLQSFDNLIVLRTLSKAYGLAGLRLGAILAQAKLIDRLKNFVPPYTVSSPVLHLAQHALADQNWFHQKIQLIVAERERLSEEFKNSPWIEKVYPSQGNFILIKSTHAKNLANWFAKFGFALRYFGAGPLETMLRITVGSKKQNQNLLAALKNYPA